MVSQPRTRIPVADDYSEALGRATYNFAYLEWAIIGLHETFDHGFLVKSRSMTAGEIATSFLKIVKALDASEQHKPALLKLAMIFDEMVPDRNRLMHGNPFTASGGEQRLSYTGKHGTKDWTIELIDEFSDNLATASVEAVRILHSA